MDWTIEVVIIPVTDVDRAIAFYRDGLGFNLDHDTVVSGDIRVVQLTPPGSGCSAVLSKGTSPMPPGSQQGIQLVVRDLLAARAELLERGVEVSEIVVYDAEGQRPMREGDDLNNAGFMYLNDPDGNGWAIQQITNRN